MGVKAIANKGKLPTQEELEKQVKKHNNIGKAAVAITGVLLVAAVIAYPFTPVVVPSVLSGLAAAIILSEGLYYDIVGGKARSKLYTDQLRPSDKDNSTLIAKANNSQKTKIMSNDKKHVQKVLEKNQTNQNKIIQR